MSSMKSVETPFEREEALIEQWEKVRCSICMEHPHQAILLLCSSHYQGCRAYICDTGPNHSNCFSKLKEELKSRNNKLMCPLCRGKVREWAVDGMARQFMNSKPRTCANEGCEFTGKYVDLNMHVNTVHPRDGPSEFDSMMDENMRALDGYVNQLELARIAMNEELRRLMISGSQ